VSFFWFSEAASAQALIKVNDTINFKLGLLLQPKTDWTQDATTRRASPLRTPASSGRPVTRETEGS
jgi:hypothetical protein